MAKAAIVVLSGMETHTDSARVLNALEAVKEFKEAGDEIELIFDGGGVTSAIAIADPEHRFHRPYTLVQDKITGICRFCARAFKVYEKAEELGLPFLAEYHQHPSIRRLVIEGYQVITF
jgi:hypothetical protein